MGSGLDGEGRWRKGEGVDRYVRVYCMGLGVRGVRGGISLGIANEN